MKKSYFLIFLLILNNYLFANNADDVAKAWTNRAYIAEGKLKNDKNLRGYEYLLEIAYGMHSSKNNFVQKHENGVDFYKILLKKSDNELFIINYCYEQKTGNLNGVKIEMLPKEWYLHIISTFPDYLVLDLNDNGECLFFNTKNPFDVEIMNLKEQP